MNDYNLNEKIVIFGDSFASSDGDFNFKENEIEHNNKLVWCFTDASYTKSKFGTLVCNIQNNNYSVI